MIDRSFGHFPKKTAGPRLGKEVLFQVIANVFNSFSEMQRCPGLGLTLLQIFSFFPFSSDLLGDIWVWALDQGPECPLAQ